jgi:peptidoglycan/LPS O-acetylase OafA/YrhL
VNDLENEHSGILKPGNDVTNRANNFNALRLFAAILVIYGHMDAILGLPEFAVIGESVSTLAVKTFFIISGFLICDSWRRDPDPIRFAIRRIFRIIPALIFVVLITTFIIGPIISTLSVREYFRNPLIIGYLKNIFLHISYGLPGVFENNIYQGAVNGSLWSLPVEMFMYFLLPVLFFIGLKCKSPKWILLIFALLLIAGNLYTIAYYNNFRIVVYATSLRSALDLAPYFFLGSLFTFPEFKKLLNIQVALAALMIAATINWPHMLVEPVLYIVLPYSVLSFALTPMPVFSKIGSRNDYSYGIYLWGFLIQQIVVGKFRTSLGGVNIYFVICTVLTFIFAIISWHLVEKNAMKFSKYLTARLKGNKA